MKVEEQQDQLRAEHIFTARVDRAEMLLAPMPSIIFDKIATDLAQQIVEKIGPEIMAEMEKRIKKRLDIVFQLEGM